MIDSANSALELELEPECSVLFLPRDFLTFSFGAL